MTSWLGFDLLRPAYLAALLAGPLVLVVGYLGLRWRARGRARLVAPEQLSRFFPRFSENRARFRVVLAAAGALLLGFALVGPVRGYTLREVRRRGLDLVICIDTSRSMLVQDLKPDRLTRAGVDVATLTSRYTSTDFDMTPLGDPQSRFRTLRALGYFQSSPLVAQRTVNETANVLSELEVRYPPAP